jgi:hypothetical protein
VNCNSQRGVHTAFATVGVPVVIVTSVEDALALR